MKNFIDRFKIDGCRIEYSKTLKKGMKTITEEEALTNKDSNIYFIGGVNAELPMDKRASDNDILYTNRMVLDLDLRKDLEAQGIIVSDDDIKAIGKKLGAEMNEDDMFKEYSFITFSGNGLHIFFLGKPIKIDKKLYSLGVECIYREFEKKFKFIPDIACRNIGRIIRLPGTVNQKNGSKTEILVSKNEESRLVSFIPAFGKREEDKVKEAAAIRLKEIEENLKLYGEDEQFYQEINEKIPAHMIAEKLLPEFKFDGRRNFNNNKGGYTGYFYSKDKNAIINGGSRYFAWGNDTSGWQPFSLIKNWYGYDNKQTFEFFKAFL